VIQIVLPLYSNGDRVNVAKLVIAQNLMMIQDYLTGHQKTEHVHVQLVVHHRLRQVQLHQVQRQVLLHHVKVKCVYMVTLQIMLTVRGN